MTIDEDQKLELEDDAVEITSTACISIQSPPPRPSFPSIPSISKDDFGQQF